MTHNQAIDEMKKYFNEEPEVGIFWYDESKEELFEVYSLAINNLSKNTMTYPKLHKTIWQKLHFKTLTNKEKGNDCNEIFLSDYTQIPRGRIFFKENIFYVFTGRWIQKNENFIKDLIINEFNLKNQNVIFKIDSHWDIGHGWSSEQDELDFD